MSDPNALLKQAVAAHGNGRLEEAEGLYRQVLDLVPEEHNSLHMLGAIELSRGRLDAAVALFDRALAGNRDAKVLYNRGVALQAAGRVSEAVESWRQAIAVRPDYHDALYNLAKALKDLGREDEAIALYRHILGFRPQDAEARRLLAELLFQSGDQDGAAQAFRELSTAQPDDAGAWYNLGVVEAARADDRAAESAYEEALRHAPEHAPALMNLGTLLHKRGQFTEAEPLLRRAVGLAPELAEGHMSLANVIRDLGDPDAAITEYDAALVLRPDYPDAEINRAMALLLAGRWGDGFDGFEARWRGAQLTRPHHPSQPWNGEPVAGKTLLLLNEQGIGDVIMFAGMIPELQTAGVSLIVATDPRLNPLFARSFPDIEVHPMLLETPDELVRRQVDFWSPLGSAARWLRRSERDFPRHSGYLKADPERVSEMQAWLGTLPAGRRIGIAWRSGGITDGSRRMTRLRDDWAVLLNRDDSVFVTLQWGDCEDELRQVREALGVTIHAAPDLDLKDDLDGIAALVCALDRVVSPATTLVHLVGALGRPVWTLVPAQPSWRWLTGRSDCLWYPAMRLFRQNPDGAERGDWSQVVHQVCAALDAERA